MPRLDITPLVIISQETILKIYNVGFFYRKPCKYLSAYWNSERTFLSITPVRKSYKNKFACGISDPCSWMIYCDVNNICSYCVNSFSYRDA